MTVVRNIEIVASEDEIDGYIAFSAMVDGVAYPLSMQKLGHAGSFAGSPTTLAVAAQDAPEKSDATPAVVAPGSTGTATS